MEDTPERRLTSEEAAEWIGRRTQRPDKTLKPLRERLPEENPLRGEWNGSMWVYRLSELERWIRVETERKTGVSREELLELEGRSEAGRAEMLAAEASTEVDP